MSYFFRSVLVGVNMDHIFATRLSSMSDLSYNWNRPNNFEQCNDQNRLDFGNDFVWSNKNCHHWKVHLNFTEKRRSQWTFQGLILVWYRGSLQSGDILTKDWLFMMILATPSQEKKGSNEPPSKLRHQFQYLWLT